MIQKNQSSDCYFSPKSKIHEINRENLLLLLGGQRALLMQLAHPLVGQGVLDHSSVREDPLTRLTRTIQLTQALVFGTKQEAAAAAQRINLVHRGVKGTLKQSAGAHPEGTTYHAHDPQLLTWVWATLIDTGVTVYEKFIKPLDDEEKESYYQESKKLLPPLGGKTEDTPHNYPDLRIYMHEMYNSKQVFVSEAAKKEITPYLLLKKPKHIRLPLLPISLPIAKITTGLLPQELRDQYELPWTKVDQKIFDTLAATSRKIYKSRLSKLIPNIVRYSPHYRKTLQ